MLSTVVAPAPMMMRAPVARMAAEGVAPDFSDKPWTSSEIKDAAGLKELAIKYAHAPRSPDRFWRCAPIRAPLAPHPSLAQVLTAASPLLSPSLLPSIAQAQPGRRLLGPAQRR